MTKEMLINTVEGQECRIAIVTDGRLEELYVERASAASKVGNIYKGRVTNVEPAIQAAFVDFGGTKNGFLHISDINPQYFPKGKRHNEQVGKKRPHRDRPPIQECIRRGQEVIVQMTKEGIGTKGPTMTTYLSIPGRLLVMMPGMSRLGVSRKIDDEDARTKAKQILADLNPPQDMGFIIRTAGLDRPKKELQRDLQYLTRLWKSVSQRVKTAKIPSELYQESDLVIRTIRDIYNSDINRIICDKESVAHAVKEFLDVAMPRTKYKVELYVGKAGIFHDFQIESELERIYSRRVELKSGGSLVIDQAEALVAIDVNSGRFRDHTDAETTAFKMNTEAALEIARQLRLRDMGGVIIIDFIDMREERNRRSVERTLRDAVKGDRAKTKVLKISPFGIVEMTRQRMRPSLKDSIFRRCPHCAGMGLIKSDESQSLLLIRNLQRAAAHPDVAAIEVLVNPSVAEHLFNHQRKEITLLEETTRKQIVIRTDTTMVGDEVRITCTNARGSSVMWESKPITAPGQAAEPITVEVHEAIGVADAEDEFTDTESAEGETPAAESQEPGDDSMSRFDDEVAPSDDQAHEDDHVWEEQDEPEGMTREMPAERAAASQAIPPQQAPAAPQEGAPQAVAPQGDAQQGGVPQGEGMPGKRRRRGRRGGRKHKKRNGLPGQPMEQGEPGAAPAQTPQQGQAQTQGQAQPPQQRQQQQPQQRQQQQRQPQQQRQQQQRQPQQQQRQQQQRPPQQRQQQQRHPQQQRPPQQQGQLSQQQATAATKAALNQAAVMQPPIQPEPKPVQVQEPLKAQLVTPEPIQAAPIPAPVEPAPKPPVAEAAPAAPAEKPTAPKIVKVARAPKAAKAKPAAKKPARAKVVRKRKPAAASLTEEAKARTEGTLPIPDDDDDEGSTGTPLFKPGD